MLRFITTFLAAAAFFFTCGPAEAGVGAGAGCLPHWDAAVGQPGLDNFVTALAVYDDGSGPALYAGGGFTEAGGGSASRIAKWDGVAWSPLGDGIDRTVNALAVYDDGSGPALFAGGGFVMAGGVAAENIAKWDGAAWSPLGAGIDGAVWCLAVFDDGSGPALYAGGNFSMAGGVAVENIAKWDGAAWSPLGAGTDNLIFALETFDDGSGEALYAGGFFTTAGGAPANSIAKWDGASWTPLGAGMDDFVVTLTAFDDGSGAGPALYAGGDFTMAGGAPANRIAKWDGASWSDLGAGMDDIVAALAVFDDGSGPGPALYAGGLFTTADGVAANRIAKWDGASWSHLGAGMDDIVFALAVLDDGSGAGPVLYAGGEFTSADGVAASNITARRGCVDTDCGQYWDVAIDQTGIDNSIAAMVVFDDGSGAGPALYVGGFFTTAGCVTANGIAKWDGLSWSALGAGVDGSVWSLAVFDDGSGPALYAGGNFTMAGGAPTNNIAKWDGHAWTALSAGVSGAVSTLEVFDDGSGPALYAGGIFNMAGGVHARHIAKWDGASWSPLGDGLNNPARALAVYDHGDGPALYAGGEFTTAGGTPAFHFARWNGVSWSGLGGVGGPVFALTVFDDGAGPSLYIGGQFASAGGVSVSNIAKWSGPVTWSALGAGMNNRVTALTVFDDGSGPALFAGGWFTTAGGVTANHIAKWNGVSWSPLGAGLDSTNFFAMAAFDDGRSPGSALVVAASFTAAGGLPAEHIAEWRGCCEPGWSPIFSDEDGLDNSAAAMAVFDDGAGPALYVGGSFPTAGGAPANRIAKWDGAAWSPLGAGVSGFVNALTVFDDGTGPALYAGGSFTSSDGVSLNRIAKWNGASWSPLGAGLGSVVHSLVVFDDGDGPALYAGGRFLTAGGAPANRIAKWDGADWTPLDGGVNNNVSALAVYDDGLGCGPALYAGGFFTTAGGVSANYIAKWDGASWHPASSGTNDRVYALTVYDEGFGGGPALFVGGDFTTAGGLSAPHVARWDGARWSPLDENGMNASVSAFATYDDGAGAGPELYAGGLFDFAGDVSAHRIAKWDGSSWSPLGAGMDHNVFTMTVYDDGAGPALYAGGQFTTAGGASSNRIAKWKGCALPIVSCPADLNGDGRVNAQDLGILLGSWGLCPPNSCPCPADITGDGRINAQDLGELLGSWGPCL